MYFSEYVYQHNSMYNMYVDTNEFTNGRLHELLLNYRFNIDCLSFNTQRRRWKEIRV